MGNRKSGSSKKVKGVDWQARAKALEKELARSCANVVDAAAAAVRLDKHNRLLRRVIGKVVTDLGGELRVKYAELARALEFGIAIENEGTKEAELVIAVIEAEQADPGMVFSAVPGTAINVGTAVVVKLWSALDPETGKIPEGEEPKPVHWPGTVVEVVKGELLVSLDREFSPYDAVQVPAAWVEVSKREDTLETLTGEAVEPFASSTIPDESVSDPELEKVLAAELDPLANEAVVTIEAGGKKIETRSFGADPVEATKTALEVASDIGVREVRGDFGPVEG